MTLESFRKARAFGAALLLCALGQGTLARAQNPAQAVPQEKDEVLRVETESVRTDVAVLDRSGKFVDVLRAGDDPARVPFTASFSLAQFPAGIYEVEVIIADNVSKATASQRVAIEVL